MRTGQSPLPTLRVSSIEKMSTSRCPEDALSGAILRMAVTGFSSLRKQRSKRGISLACGPALRKSAKPWMTRASLELQELSSITLNFSAPPVPLKRQIAEILFYARAGSMIARHVAQGRVRSWHALQPNNYLLPVKRGGKSRSSEAFSQVPISERPMASCRRSGVEPLSQDVPSACSTLMTTSDLESKPLSHDALQI